jgi:hypothetical protein
MMMMGDVLVVPVVAPVAVTGGISTKTPSASRSIESPVEAVVDDLLLVVDVVIVVDGDVVVDIVLIDVQIWPGPSDDGRARRGKSILEYGSGLNAGAVQLSQRRSMLVVIARVSDGNRAAPAWSFQSAGALSTRVLAAWPGKPRTIRSGAVEAKSTCLGLGDSGLWLRTRPISGAILFSKAGTSGRLTGNHRSSNAQSRGDSRVDSRAPRTQRSARAFRDARLRVHRLRVRFDDRWIWSDIRTGLSGLRTVGVQ